MNPFEVDDLFELNPRAAAKSPSPSDRVPLLVVDDLFQNPAALRAAALKLHYVTPGSIYPGQQAHVPRGNAHLQNFTRSMLEFVNRQFVAKAALRIDGRRIERLNSVKCDFSVVDRHPSELLPSQTIPHRDPVPVFGLVYLNEQPRGGTLFFSEAAEVADRPRRSGYFTASDDRWKLCGRVEGRFNRLAVYPGYIPHSAEIAGDWISDERRFTEPRLTLRLIFAE